MTNESIPNGEARLGLFRDYKIQLSALFDAYASLFPESAQLWRSAAAVHRDHTQSLQRLMDENPKCDFFVRAEPALDAILRQFSTELELAATDAADGLIGMENALERALHFVGPNVEGRFAPLIHPSRTDVVSLFLSFSATSRAQTTQLRNVSRSRTPFSRLIDRELLTENDLLMARTAAKNSGDLIENTLISQFSIEPPDLLDSYCRYHNLAPYDFDPDRPLSDSLARFVTLNAALLDNRFVPVMDYKNVLTVATSVPSDLTVRDRLQSLFPDKLIVYLMGLPMDIAETIRLTVQRSERLSDGGIDAPLSNLIGELERETLSLDEIQPARAIDSADEVNENDATVIRLVNGIIENANRRKASDIHIEPSMTEPAIVRFRIDGEMRKILTFPSHFWKAALSRIKIMASLDIAQRRKPQSGKIKFKEWGGDDIELRVEIVPTSGSVEDAVMRILASSKPIPLEKMGFSETNLKALKKAIIEPYGVILCVGPTGSGKTTTLHSALGAINDETMKILTVEDPVEITQAGLRQVQVNRLAGLDFASALRSFLRADPDVVMVGEMRDTETAKIAIEASLTGHLVFSTLHTNSAAETITRLLEMGIDAFSFADALIAILAQRLARRLCPKCRVASALTKETIATLRNEYGNDAGFDALSLSAGNPVYASKPGGCEYCNDGFKGRLGVHELLVNSDSLKSLILKSSNAMTIQKQAVADGMRLLKHDGIEKAIAGWTTMSEISAVCRL
ncbi:MAG: type II/IV secretion system protein [Planctomycetota bacterium]